MKITVNNKDKFFLLVAIVGFIAFFLPWVGGGFFGQHSGYDLLTYGKEMGESKSWFLLLLPISFLVVALAKLQVIKNINPIFLKIIEIIPIALILFSFSKLFEALGIRLEDLGEMDGELFENFKFGFPLTILSSIILIFSPLAKQSRISKEYSIERKSPEQMDYRKTGEELGKNLAATGKKISSSPKGFSNWLKVNTKILYLLGVLVIGLIAVWLIIWRITENSNGRISNSMPKEFPNDMNENKERHFTYNAEEVRNTTSKTHNPVSKSTDPSKFEGAWFEINIPKGFSAFPSLKSSTADGYESVFLKSSDNKVEFYVFSPQWNGEPTDIELDPTIEKQLSSETKSSKTDDITWKAIEALDGSYKRAYQDTKSKDGSIRWVIGLKYTDQDAYNLYKNDYLSFKKSLVQFGD